MYSQISMLEAVAVGLGELIDRVVFVGGVAAVLYMDSPAANEPRPTDDVDCIVEALAHHEYAAFEEKLRLKGFVDDSSLGAPICRKVFKGIKVDIMPTETRVLGFSNRWYVEGINEKIMVQLPSGIPIFVLPLAYFISSKCEAFLQRGSEDPRQSSDLEDIILVLDGCTNPFAQLRDINTNVRLFVRQVITELRRRDFREIVGCFLARESDLRIDRIEGIFRECF